MIHITSSLGDGGAEGALFRLIKAGRRDACHRVICFTDVGKYGPLLDELGVRVDTLGMRSGRLSLSGLRQLRILLAGEKTENVVVQTWMYHADLIGGIVARLVGHRRVFWGIRNNFLDSSAHMTRIVAKCCALVSRWVPACTVSCSVAAAEYHRGLGYKREIVTVPNGYAMDSLSVDAQLGQQLRIDLGLKSGFVLGSVARWDPIKDHRNLLDAVSRWACQCPDQAFTLLLVGGGCDEKNVELNRMIGEFGLERHVLTLGRRSDIPALMNAFDIHILSSKSEAFPNVVAEAMACGTPCVATNVGDVSEIVGDTGWVVDAESAGELAQGIQLAFEAYGRNGLPRQECRDRIEAKFSLDAMVKGFQEVWASPN